jgi:exopolysaccharide biosynthesis protein
VRGALRFGGPAAFALLLSVVLVPPAVAAPPQPGPTPEGAEQVLGDVGPEVEVAAGVVHRGFSTSPASGQVMGDVVEVDLTQPGVRADLLTPGAVAARAPVAKMADSSDAVAGINGDFFDIGRTSAPVGPAVQDGRALKAAAPQGRRYGPAVPGAEVDYVFTVGTDGVARIDRLRLEAQASSQDETLPIVAFNQHAVPVDGIAIFTSDWGEADRARTLCGSNDDRDAPCARDRVEVLVRDGVVVESRKPQGGRLQEGDIVLAGRDKGAAELRDLPVGEPIEIEYALVPASGVAPEFALGGSPILLDGKPTERLDDRVRAPRSAVGASEDGEHMFLVTVDGRQRDSVGATLLELSNLLKQMGIHDAVNLDGGGSSTMVFQEDGDKASQVTIVNDPSDSSARLVPNGIGIYVDRARAASTKG